METSNSVTIHRATVRDLERLLPLVQAYRVFYKQTPDPKRQRMFIESHLRHHTSTIYLALVDDSPAGFMQLFKTYSTVWLCGSYILEDLYVEPAFRRSGVGNALLSQAIAHASEDGAGGMFLETAHDNRAAQALYEQAGWTREGRFIKYNAPLR
jgi:ribosomal protein S18 acetylase RimI-like enzyme